MISRLRMDMAKTDNFLPSIAQINYDDACAKWLEVRILSQKPPHSTDLIGTFNPVG